MEYRRIEDYKIQYVGYGLEICPKTGKEHHQGWLYCNTNAKKSFKAWKKIFTALGLGAMHFDRMKGSFVQNVEYVSKDGKITELGVKPTDNSHKRVLLDYKKEIVTGKDVLAIADSDDMFGTFLQYRSGLHEYAQYKRGKAMQADREPPKVYIRIGPHGTGKSCWLDEQYGLTGWVEAPDNTGKWFDGCDTSDVVVFNNVDHGSCPSLDVLKKFTDRYPGRRAVKGGFIWFKPKVLVFTSNSHPFEWWPDLTDFDKGAIERRITECVAVQ